MASYDVSWHYSRVWPCGRSHFSSALSTGMRNDAPDDSVVQRQAWRLAEISLEELAGPGLANTSIHTSTPPPPPNSPIHSRNQGLKRG